MRERAGYSARMKTTLGWVAVAMTAVAAGMGAAKEPSMTNSTPAKPPPAAAMATFAGGCFWCMEAVFEQIPGVLRVTSGYTGGRVENPDYKQVCHGGTGHAEAIRIEYDPAKTRYEQLLDVFWSAHDPTQLNRQGNDIGEQYRSVIYAHDDAQFAAAEASLRRIQAALGPGKKVVTAVERAGPFYEAEGYHQDYYRNNREAPYCRGVIAPKLKKLNLKP